MCFISNISTLFQSYRFSIYHDREPRNRLFLILNSSTPSGTKYITSNGTYDVSSYAYASVNVSTPIDNSSKFLSEYHKINTTASQLVTINTSFSQINFVGLTLYYTSGSNAGKPRTVLIYDRERNSDKFTRAGASTYVTQSALVSVPTNSSDKSLTVNNGTLQFMPAADGVVNVFIVGE